MALGPPGGERRGHGGGGGQGGRGTGEGGRAGGAGWCRDVANGGGVSRPDGNRGLVQGRSAGGGVLAVRLRLCSAARWRDVAIGEECPGRTGTAGWCAGTWRPPGCSPGSATSVLRRGGERRSHRRGMARPDGDRRVRPA